MYVCMYVCIINKLIKVKVRLSTIVEGTYVMMLLPSVEGEGPQIVGHSYAS